MTKSEYIRRLDEVSISDIGLVGGKNASIGEMIQNLSAANVRVPGGFAVTSTAFDLFLKDNNLEKAISDNIKNLDIENVDELKRSGGFIRDLILNSQIPKVLEDAIEEAYIEMCKNIGSDFSVAVRSSATAEDLPDASIEIKDLMGDNNHYSAIIKSSKFNNLNKIEQHKLVYKSLKGKMGNELHALSITTEGK